MIKDTIIWIMTPHSRFLNKFIKRNVMKHLNFPNRTKIARWFQSYYQVLSQAKVAILKMTTTIINH